MAAYTFLALLDLKPSQPWSEAADPLRGITPIIDFVAEAYGVRYAPNTRETIRDEAVKYFVEAGMVIEIQTTQTVRDQRQNGLSDRADGARTVSWFGNFGMERKTEVIFGCRTEFAKNSFASGSCQNSGQTSVR